MSAKHTGVVSACIGGVMSVPFETSLVEDLVGVVVQGWVDLQRLQRGLSEEVKRAYS